MKGRRLKSIEIRKEPPPTNLYIGVADRLKALIAERKLKPGDRIPSERSLARKLSVGRPAIRDALRILETLGLIRVVPRQGSFVLNPSLDPYLRSMGEWLGLAVDGRRDLLLSLCEARMILAGEIAALAARRASEEEMGRIQAVLKALEASLGKAGPFFEADREFHRSIAEAAKNPILLKLEEGLSQLLAKGLAKALRLQELRGEAFQGHLRILQAIEHQAAWRAKKEMVDHLKGIARYLVETSY